MNFPYGDTETDYLRERDPRLGVVIDRLGHIDRELDPDLFTAVTSSIVAQQISNAVLATVWGRVNDLLGGEVNPERVLAAGTDAIQACGMTFRKAGYITDFASRVADGSFDLEAVSHMTDAEAVAALSSLRGVGTWTAEMILLFSLARPDILAFDDLGIQRGMCLVYHHRKITRDIFARHRRRLSPYGSIASLYFWEVAANGMPGE